MNDTYTPIGVIREELCDELMDGTATERYDLLEPAAFNSLIDDSPDHDPPLCHVCLDFHYIFDPSQAVFPWMGAR